MDKLTAWAGRCLNYWGYWCGRLDSPVEGAPPRLSLGSPLWGIWWSVLLILILTFCGQSSKFIYIDF